MLVLTSDCEEGIKNVCPDLWSILLDFLHVSGICKAGSCKGHLELKTE